MDVEQQGTSGPVVVAVHGIQGTRGSWKAVAEALCADHRVVLPNLRGRGAAARGGGPADYTLAAYAGDLAEVVSAQVGDAPYVLAGWSLGVSVGLAYVLAGLGRMPRGLVLVSGTPSLAHVAWFTGHGGSLMDSVVQRRRRLGLVDHADDDAVAWTWQSICRTDQRPDLARIDIPTLVIHGRADDDCPVAHGTWLADGLRGRLVALDVVGHGVLAQATSEVVAQARGFVRETLQTPASAPGTPPSPTDPATR